MYQVSPKLQIGLEYNPVVSELAPLLNYEILSETENSPLISFGTSSDRIGTPEGTRCYYLTFSKAIHGANIAPYVSINYSEFEDGLNFPFGVNINLSEDWVLLPMNDGRRTHLLLTYRQMQYSVSLMWVWFRHPGVSLSWKF